MGTAYKQDFIHTNVVISTTGSWVKLANNLTSRDTVLILNQGVSNDMTTTADVRVLFHLDESFTPSAEQGIILQTRDSIELPAYSTVGIWYQTATSNASLEVIEYEKEFNNA